MIVAHFLISAFIEDFDGLIINFPLNFQNVQPRKSKPLSIWVIIVFSSDKAWECILNRANGIINYWGETKDAFTHAQDRSTQRCDLSGVWNSPIFFIFISPSVTKCRSFV